MARAVQVIRAQMDKIGKNADQVARAIHEELSWNDSLDRQVPIEELSAHLAQLLQGSADGVGFFLQDGIRRDALAKVLKMPAEQIAQLRTSRVLVLHPLLPTPIRDHLVTQQHADRYTVVEVTVPEVDLSHAQVEPTDSGMKVTGLARAEMQAVREALRKAAQAELGCLVVAPMDDRGFYIGADIETTEVQEQPLGYVLTAAPDLVPPAPAKPPPKFDDDDGAPLIPHDKFEELARKDIKDYEDPPWGAGGVYRGKLLKGEPALLRLRDRMRRLAEHRIRPAFRPDELLPWWASTEGIDLRAISELTFEDVMADDLRATFWWAVQGELNAAGPDCDRLEALVAPHHRLIRSEEIHVLREAILRCNPFRQQPAAGPLDRFHSATGCTLQVDRLLWKQQVDLEAKLRLRASDAHDSVGAPRWTVRPGDRAPAEAARKQIRLLLEREFVLGLDTLDMPLLLHRLLDCALVVLPPEGHDVLHVVADLGDSLGKTRVRAMRFAAEQPAPFEASSDECNEFDGGDVHLWIRPLERRN